MFHIINSIPLWIRLLLLFCSEIIIIFVFIKNKHKYDKAFKMFFLLMLIIVPVVMIGMIVSRYNSMGLIQGVAQNIANVFPVIIGGVLTFGIVITAIIQVKTRKLADAHRNIFIFGLVVVFLGVFMILVGLFF